VLALLLGRKGVNVEIFEATDEVDKRLRATHFSSAATRVLQRVGILDEIRETGVITKRVVWRKPDGTLLAALDYESLPEDHKERMVALPLPEVCSILLNKIPALPTVQLRWKHKVVDAGQDQGTAWVDVESVDGKQRIEADYIIGCDGASSKIRQLFAGKDNYPGLTWDEQLVATNVSSHSV
jgi:2-polyprenyl-6-methoxyphenol hydroxylase-like FAD-dependent oxidoreductase